MTLTSITLQITYDNESDAAYISLNQFSGGWADSVNIDPIEIGGIVAIDLDSGKRILGIEVYGASNKLPVVLMDEIRKQAESQAQGKQTYDR
jgi:uncharacterized protein YuzE